MKLHTLMLVGLIAGAACVPAARAQAPDSGAFYVRLGNDTIAVETYVRTPQKLLAEAVLRTPETRRYRLTVVRNEDGTIAAYEVLNDPVAGVPNAAPPMQSLTTYEGDSARVESWVNGVPRRARVVAAKADMVPLQLPFHSTYETVLMQARKAATDTLTVHMLAGSGPLRYLVRWIGADSVTLFNPQAGTIRARVDTLGRVLDFSGEATTFKVVVTRAKWVDLEQVTSRFAAADAAGRAFGALSPRDSLEVAIGESSAVISYGRPSKRGRVVFGGIVPWGEVWRTGANAATHIQFSSPVQIHGVVIPAGRYTLWTVPGRRHWQLIINRQTGQWGTNYDESQDIARIEVVSETIAVPVETFRIATAQQDHTTTVVTLTWDRTRVLVPIKEAKAE